MATLEELLEHKATLEAEVADLREDIASIDATITEMVAQEYEIFRQYVPATGPRV